MWNAEGLTSFTKGLGPAVSRAMVYGGLRLGLYAPIRDAMHPNGTTASLSSKLAAGVLSGAVAAAATNPLDLVKTRLQVQHSISMSTHATQRGPLAVLHELIATQGLPGLWKGTAAGATRAAVLTASQCATYDASKRVCTVVQLDLTSHRSRSLTAGMADMGTVCPRRHSRTHWCKHAHWSCDNHCNSTR